MPTYDYVCRACGHRLEVVHGREGHGPEVCPVCGGRMRKAISAAAVHFKGSGWAKKDRSPAPTTKAAAKAAGSGGDDHGSRRGDDHASSSGGDDPPSGRGDRSSSRESEAGSDTGAAAPESTGSDAGSAKGETKASKPSATSEAG